MLSFKPLSLSDKDNVFMYFNKYGEGSCQHSFVSSFCLSCKYDDHIAIDEDALFILRNGKCSDSRRVYLFPMCERSDSKLFDAINKVIVDSHDNDKKVRFETITESSKDIIERLFPDTFEIEELRDYFEYIYTFDTLANLPGSELSSKRYDLKTFERDYGTRFKERIIEIGDIDEILEFQHWWLTNRDPDGEDVQLELENESIIKGLRNYRELGLSGILTYIDDKLVGYAYGTKLSDDYFDVLIEKGNRKYPDIYKVLNRDLVKMCCQNYKYINREEDVGVPGLRKAKMSYKPDFFIKKYIAREK